jgi:surface antigen
VRKIASLIICILFLTAPLAPAGAISCVPYARAASGIQLSGDAWQWWDHAAGLYARGSAPHAAAVLVFARQGHMRQGHVAVVTKVINRREVLVDHANWAPGRGKVAHDVPVRDVSPRNDWTQVRVWFQPGAQYGNRVYRTDGFVYGRSESAPRGALHQASLRQVSRGASAPAGRVAAGHARHHPTHHRVAAGR